MENGSKEGWVEAIILFTKRRLATIPGHSSFLTGRIKNYFIITQTLNREKVAFIFGYSLELLIIVLFINTYGSVSMPSAVERALE